MVNISYSKKSNQNGYALVSVIIAAVMLLGVLSVLLQYIATIASSSRNTTHSIVATNAALNGIIAGSACLQQDLSQLSNNDVSYLCASDGLTGSSLRTVSQLVQSYQLSTNTDWGHSYNLSLTSKGVSQQNFLSRNGILKANLSSHPATKKPSSNIIANSDTHACAIARGKVYCWGRNDFGQLGNGTRATSSNYNNPVAVDMSSSESSLRGKVVTDITTGTNFSCALAANEIHCWGDNRFKQLGNGANNSINISTTPRKINTFEANNPIQFKRITQIQARGNRVCVVASLEAYCWGKLSMYEASDAMSPEGFNAPQYKSQPIAYPVRVGSTVFGQLKNKPVDQISLAHQGMCALSRGETYCWGIFPLADVFTRPSSNVRDITWGSLMHSGSAPTYNSNSPRRYHASSYTTSITTGRSHACTITEGHHSSLSVNNRAECFGGNGFGQLGIKERTYNWSDYNETKEWRNPNILADRPWEYDINGLNTLDPPRIMLKPFSIFRDVRQIDTNGSSLSGNHTCMIDRSAEVRCWGDNVMGQSGQAGSESSGGTSAASTVNRPTPVNFNKDTDTHLAEQLSVSSLSSCSINYDGIYCWGDYRKHSNLAETNEPMMSGNLGHMNYPLWAANTKPVKIDFSHLGLRPKDFLDRSAQMAGSCNIDSSGTVYCWESKPEGNKYGQLGDGTTTPRRTPVAIHSKYNKDSIIRGKSFTQVATGEDHACGLSGGNIYCWGKNGLGQLGSNASVPYSSTPVAVSVSGASELPAGQATYLASGKNTTCALADRKLYCWGHNPYGMIRQNLGATVRYPVQIDIDNNASSLKGKALIQLAIGDEHICGLANDNTLHCWGSNKYGQLGNGTTQDSLHPKQIDTSQNSSPLHDKDIRWISAGYNHTCAIGSSTTWTSKNTEWDLYNINDKVACWGRNHKGQLGTEDTLNRTMPSPITSNELRTNIIYIKHTRILGIAASGDNTCSIIYTDRSSDYNPEVFCWGDNSHKQIPNRNNDSEGYVNHPTAALRDARPAKALIGKAQFVTLTPRGGCIATAGYSPMSCWGYNVGFSGKLGKYTSLDKQDSSVITPQASKPDYRETVIY